MDVLALGLVRTVAFLSALFVSMPIIQGTASRGPGASEDTIYISLPYMLSIVVAAVAATWTVARYSMSRERELDRLRQMLDDHIKRSQKNR